MAPFTSHTVVAPSIRRTPSDVSLTLRQCQELRTLLLHAAPPKVAPCEKPYAPRVAHLLDAIEATLQQATPTADGKFIIEDAISDVTSSCSPSLLSPLLSSPPSESESESERDLGSTTLFESSSSSDLLAKPDAAAYKNDTEIAISRIFDLGSVAAVVDPSIPVDAPVHGPSVVSMTGFGELGRFGNQVLQYAFLVAYARRHHIAHIQVPAWVGTALFGHAEAPVARALPPVVEFAGTRANSTFTDEFIDYVKRSNAHRVVPEMHPDILGHGPGARDAPRNVDIWGWFQWHSAHLAPFKDDIRAAFAPVAATHAVRDAFQRNLRFRGGRKRTVVGLHFRLGDYQNISASSFGYCAPTAWYRAWLAEIWPTLDDPVLFVASDDLDAVRKDFADYDVQTADSCEMELGDDMRELKAGFFPDWYGLTQCDVLAISNSTFSFSACMMNERPAACFFRAHYSGVMQPFQPWNADPIVHREADGNVLGAAAETLAIVYRTQGVRGLMRNVFVELPCYAARAAVMKAVLWRKASA